MVEPTLISYFGVHEIYEEKSIDLPRPYPHEPYQTQHNPGFYHPWVLLCGAYPCLCSSEVMELMRGFSVLVDSRTGQQLTHEIRGTVTCSTLFRCWCEDNFCSLSGRSKRCPKMPSNLYAGTHYCRLSMYSLGAKQCIPFPDGQGTCKIFVALG